MTHLYLTAHELAELVDCKPNQYACMCRWLDRNGWRYERSRLGIPKVLRKYHDEKMGIAIGGKSVNSKLATEPNYEAFAL